VSGPAPLALDAKSELPNDAEPAVPLLVAAPVEADCASTGVGASTDIANPVAKTADMIASVIVFLFITLFLIKENYLRLPQISEGLQYPIHFRKRV
jgi:hypothetical protein